uniref:Predicted protein n=1 Tax=Physcomitrium patens TaxID=3218 RepID=A9U478_PHYPA
MTGEPGSKSQLDPISRHPIQAVLFSVPFQGTLFSIKGSLKESQWIQDCEYKAVSKISSLGCSGFSVTSRDLPAGAKRTSTSSGRASVKIYGVFLQLIIFQQSKTDKLLEYWQISILPSTAKRSTRSRARKHQQQSNDRKKAWATIALQAVVNKIDQFDGRNISRYLRCYVHEMELNRIFEKKMVELFGLAMIPEIRDHITSITDRYGNSWVKLFLGWIERPNNNLQATELLREFERQYSQLSKVEKLTLEPNKVDLFLQAADRELQGKLELLLEDKVKDEGLTTKWKNVEDAVELLTKRERRKDRSNISKTVQAPKAPIRTTPPTMPTVQLLTSLLKKADIGMEEIIRGMRDLRIKLARLEENTSTNNLKNVSKQGYGGMRALVQDYLKEHETAARESASYGARVDDEIGGSTETTTIRGRTSWEDPVEFVSVLAYITKSQHEALMEEKRRGNFDDTREGNSFKRQTQGDKAREATSQELPVKDNSTSLGEKTKETKDKGKSIAYKLLFDIEEATNLKGVLEERILNAKVEFTLKEVLEIAKKEFHDIIIDSIKRKRQLMSETGMSHAIDARIYKEEEEVDIGYKQSTNEKNGYNQRVRFKDYSDKEMETLSHYTRKHWARVTTESEYGRKAVQFLTIPHNHERNRDRLREKTLPKIVEGFKDLGELGILQDDERILGVYEENGLEDSLELITSIGLGDNDKIVEIHSREVYTILESFQTPEVTVERRYKTADKKIKPVAGPLPEDSKEQMGEASKEASLRDPMSIGHQFTKETFEELKIGSDGSLLSEEITCFKKMLAKQDRSFAFESHEIGCVDPNIITPMVIFTVSHVP